MLCYESFSGFTSNICCDSQFLLPKLSLSICFSVFLVLSCCFSSLPLPICLCPPPSFLRSFLLQSFCLSFPSILLFPFISFTRFTLMHLFSYMFLIVTFFYTLTFLIFIHSFVPHLSLSLCSFLFFPIFYQSLLPPYRSLSLFFLVQWRVLSGSLCGCYSNGSREWGMCC